MEYKSYQKVTKYIPNVFFSLVFIAGLVFLGLAYNLYENIPTETLTVGKIELPPHYLMINGEQWDVELADFSSDTSIPGGVKLADTNCHTRTIRYGYRTYQAQIRDSLWHEIFHAFRCHDSILDDQLAHWVEFTDGTEHKTVYKEGMWMAAFTHDNPEFMVWSENW